MLVKEVGWRGGGEGRGGEGRGGERKERGKTEMRQV